MGRTTLIRQHLYSHGLTSIQDLAALTGASLPTIRRDLQQLESEGRIQRVRGGATIAANTTLEVAFELREKQQLTAKRAIGDEAYKLLCPNTTIFLDAGTTVLQLARKLRLSPIPLTVFTNSLAIAQELMVVPGISVSLLGGRVRAENLSVVGPLAELMLDRLWFDQVFIGIGTIDGDENGTIYSVDLQEASLNARMMARATQTVALVDASKFGRIATYVVGSLKEVSHVITDSGLDEAWRSRIADGGGALTVAAVELGTEVEA
jgi:DeoR family fructose operon transcriptional repressor